MEGKGLFYYFLIGILVPLNAYPDIDVRPFLPLRIHLGTENTAQGPVDFSWMCEQLGTNLPEISPMSKETSTSGNLKKCSQCINTKSLKTAQDEFPQQPFPTEQCQLK